MQSEAKAKALEQFTDYFVKNYPGPDTIIYNPNWHAPKIFAAAYSAITAAISDKQAGEVKIKPLEWNRRNSDGTIHIATALPGEYWAWELAKYGYWSWGSLSGREVPGGLEAAKAAAQADYEQRILSAICGGARHV